MLLSANRPLSATIYADNINFNERKTVLLTICLATTGKMPKQAET